MTSCWKSEPTPKQTLYVIHARSGRFLSDPDNPASEGNLTLFQADPDVVFFDSIPVKKTGLINLNRFVKQWSQRFHQGPPNAGFVFYHDMKNAFDEISVTIDDPQIDPINHSINFKLKAIGDSFRYDTILMDEVTLFVDEVKS